MVEVARGDVRFRVEPDPVYAPLWQHYETGEWEPETFGVLDAYLTPESSLIDIGAAVGAVALYAANKCRLVVAVEPLREAVNFLRANVALNPGIAGRVQIVEGALAPKTGTTSFGPDTDLFSDIVFTWGSRNYEIDSWTLEDLVARFDAHDCALVKIDIEGGEYIVVPSRSFQKVVRRLAPTLYIQIHPGSLRTRLYSRTLYGRLRYLAAVVYDHARLAWGLRKYDYLFEGSGREIRAWMLVLPRFLRRRVDAVLATNDADAAARSFGRKIQRA